MAGNFDLIAHYEQDRQVYAQLLEAHHLLEKARDAIYDLDGNGDYRDDIEEIDQYLKKHGHQ